LVQPSPKPTKLVSLTFSAARLLAVMPSLERLACRRRLERSCMIAQLTQD
jgi:hypothetical protein